MKQGRSLEELAAELVRRQNVKKDYLLDTRMMQMDAAPNFEQITITNDRSGESIILKVNDVADNQIRQYLDIPAKYYEKMKQENPELLAHNVNSWFRKQPEVRMVRTLDGTARAFLSDRYHRIDNYEIAQAVLPVIAEMQDAKVESCEITDERLYIKVVNPRLTTEVVPGDIVQSGMLITNSEVGLGQFTVQPLVYRLVCTNGMVVNDARMSRRHVGKRNEMGEDYSVYRNETMMVNDMAFMMKVQDTVRSVVDRTKFEKVVGMMRQAKEAKITTANIPAMVELGSSDFGYTKTEGEGILSYLIRGGDLSLYGYANAATRYAQDVASYDRSTVLESIGYDILGMSPAQWNKLQAIEMQVA